MLTFRHLLNGSPSSFIFLYSPAYNIGYNALTYTFLVELFPFHVRAKGISVFQWWSRCAAFFNQFVNPIGIKNAGWKYYISHCIFLAFEVAFVYFIFPETSGKSLEELAFCKYLHLRASSVHPISYINCSVRGEGSREAEGTYQEGNPGGPNSNNTKQHRPQERRLSYRIYSKLGRGPARTTLYPYHEQLF
jgi:hypothetical protein